MNECHKIDTSSRVRKTEHMRQITKLRHILPPPNTCAEYRRIAHKFRMPNKYFFIIIIVIVNRSKAERILIIVLHVLTTSCLEPIAPITYMYINSLHYLFSFDVL